MFCESNEKEEDEDDEDMRPRASRGEYMPPVEPLCVHRSLYR
jgi:hypothetical protein